MGTPQAAVPSLERIVKDGHGVLEVWTQPDRPSGRGRRVHPPPVKISAEKLSIPVFQPSKIKNKESRKRFAALDADLAVVVAYGRILTKTYLEAFRYGCINVHFSVLPKYRGAAPVNWAVANGERVTGVTTMKMDAGLDTGDILLKEEVGIGPEETAVELMERLALLGSEVLSRTLRDIDSIEPAPQDDSAATYAPLFEKDDGRIDWSMPARQISDRIRGFQPFPKSFSFYNGERVTFWKATPVEGTCDAQPGEIVTQGEEDFLICCGGRTLLRIDELQFAGRRKTPAVELLKGVKIKAGGRFGDE